MNLSIGNLNMSKLTTKTEFLKNLHEFRKNFDEFSENVKMTKFKLKI